MRGIQLFTAKRIVEQNKIAVWLDMGMGKTRATLSALTTLYLLGDIKRVLVMAPPLVAEETWPAEIEKWEVPLSYAVLNGDKTERRRKLRENADIHIMSRDLVRWLWAQYTRENWPYDVIVYDESSRLGSQSNLAWKALKKMYDDVPRLIQLTGTPMGNGYKKLWSQAYLLDKGKALGRAEYLYREKYFKRNPYSGEVTLIPGAEDAILERLKPLTVTLRAKDHIDMPDVMYIDKKFSLPPVAMRHYKDMVNEYIVELRTGKIEAFNAGIRINKLLQISGGGIYTEKDPEGKTEPVELHKARLEALAEIVDENNGAPMLITYYYKFQLNQLTRAYPKAEVYTKGRNTSARWNAGEIPMLFIHPASVGYGLNLQFGGSVLIWFGLTWSLDDFLQTNARIARPGQDKKVRVFQIAANNTADEYLFSRISEKNEKQESLLDGLKSILEIDV